MITYLYVKTHNVTGLKYLGKTTKEDPHKYIGSGKYWRLHLRKHGYDYTTEILKECTSKEEVKQLGVYYSELWDVVASDEWANLKPENGDGGGVAGTKRSPESIAKMIASRKANGTLNPNNPESISKRLATRKANDSFKRSSEAIAKQVATIKANDSNRRSSESIEKMRKSREANGTLNTNTPESIEKMLATRSRNKANNL